jgi:ferredoxin-NAD(P)+ reductase (naphthalene dioxygenase ferredoxin-specific)
MLRRVRIEQFDQEIAVGPDETILAAALELGLDYPFMCQQGQCGACKSYLVAGEVDLGNFYNPMVLPDEERRRGLILACQARPLSDCVVSIGELAGQLGHVVRETACVVSAKEQAAAEMTVLRLAPRDGVPLLFSAGQYAMLTFAGLPPREYSMANRPGDRELEFHVQHLPNGLVTGHVATHLAVGDPVSLRGPFGTAYFRDEHLGPVLLAAGGSGLAPIESIVETALASGLTQRFHLYVGARTEANLYREDRLRALAARHRNLILVFALSDAAGDSARRRGTVSEVVAGDFDDLSAFHAYLAGPPRHCETTRDVLLARGLPAEACFMDPFVTAGDR